MSTNNDLNQLIEIRRFDYRNITIYAVKNYRLRTMKGKQHKVLTNVVIVDYKGKVYLSLGPNNAGKAEAYDSAEEIVEKVFRIEGNGHPRPAYTENLLPFHIRTGGGWSATSLAKYKLKAYVYGQNMMLHRTNGARHEDPFKMCPRMYVPPFSEAHLYEVKTVDELCVGDEIYSPYRECITVVKVYDQYKGNCTAVIRRGDNIATDTTVVGTIFSLHGKLMKYAFFVRKGEV